MESKFTLHDMQKKCNVALFKRKFCSRSRLERTVLLLTWKLEEIHRLTPSLVPSCSTAVSIHQKILLPAGWSWRCTEEL